jgi:hypothetical protein
MWIHVWGAVDKDEGHFARPFTKKPRRAVPTIASLILFWLSFPRVSVTGRLAS